MTAVDFALIERLAKEIHLDDKTIDDAKSLFNQFFDKQSNQTVILFRCQLSSILYRDVLYLFQQKYKFIQLLVTIQSVVVESQLLNSLKAKAILGQNNKHFTILIQLKKIY